MQAIAIQPPFSNLQMELLQLYAVGVPDSYLSEIKEILARYLLEKARDEADKIWDDKGYSAETVENWISGHQPASA